MPCFSSGLRPLSPAPCHSSSLRQTAWNYAQVPAPTDSVRREDVGDSRAHTVLLQRLSLASSGSSDDRVGASASALNRAVRLPRPSNPMTFGPGALSVTAGFGPPGVVDGSAVGRSKCICSDHLAQPRTAARRVDCVRRVHGARTTNGKCARRSPLATVAALDTYEGETCCKSTI